MWLQPWTHGRLIANLCGMAPTNPDHTPIQRFRLDQNVWDELEVVAEAHGLDRSKLLAEFARWITRIGNVRSAPSRPAATDLERARQVVVERRVRRESRRNPT